MTISVTVHGELNTHDEEDDYIDDGSHVHEQEFSTTRLVSRLQGLLKKLKKNKVEELSIFNEDTFLSLLDHGGELDHDDVLLLAEDLEVVTDHFPEIHFNNEDDREAIEIFIDELRDVLEACQHAEGSLEFFNNEESIDVEEAMDEADDAEADEEAEDIEDDEEDETFDDEDMDADEGERAEAESFISKILGGAFEALEGDAGTKDSPTKEK